MKKSASFFIWLCIVVFVLFLLLIAAFVYTAKSPTANQYLLNKISELVPEVTFDSVSGNLVETLHFNLRYQDDSVAVSAHSAAIRVKPECIWQITLCLEDIRIDTLQIQLLKTTHQKPIQTDTIKLPSVSTPILIHLRNAHVRQLTISELNAETTLYHAENIQLQASWIDHHIKTKQVSAIDDYCQWSVDGGIRLTRNYPITASIDCVTSIYPMRNVSAKVSGNLLQLDINAITSGTLASDIRMQLNPLADVVALEFKVNLRQPFIYQSDDFNATALTAKLSGSGNINNLNVGLSAALKLDQFAEPLILNSRATIEPTRLILDQIDISLPKGNIASQGTVSFTSGIHWHGNTRLSQIALAQFDPTITGDINGNITHSGSLIEQQVSASIAFDNLKGTLFDTPWSAQGKATLNNTTADIDTLTLIQDQNRVSVSGQISTTGESNLHADFNIVQFNQILPDLQGSLKGSARITGNVDNPGINGKAIVERLEYEETKLQHATVTLNWQSADSHNNKLHVQFSDLVNSGINTDGQISVIGDYANHRVNIALTEAQGYQFKLHCQGKFPGNDLASLTHQWDATCHKSNINIPLFSPAQNWRLQKTLHLTLSNLNTVTLSPFCYGYQSSIICSKKPLTIDPSLELNADVDGQNLNVAWLQPWLPQNIKISGKSDITSNIKLVKDQYNASATLNSRSIKAVISDAKNNAIPVEFSSFDLNVNTSEKHSELHWRFNTNRAGNSEGNITLQQESISGQVNFDNVILRPFSNLVFSEEGDYVQGIVAGELSLSGSLKEPELTGTIHARDGEIHSAILPLPITNINIELNTKDKLATVTGDFKIQDKPGVINGELNWQQAQWWSKVDFHAETLAYQPDDNILIYLTPNLTFEITPSSVHLTGDVHVPKARIFLKSLPEQAVGISPDVEIIGDKSETESPIHISSNLNISLGDDVKFKGYGLETNVIGQMKITQNQSDLIRSKGIIRLEKGIYQAYGQSLIISDGDLVFIDDLANPQLRLSATKENVADNVVVGIRVTGRASNPDISIFSIPEMPQQEKFHYLITGRAPNTDSTLDSSSVAAEAALAMALESRSGFTRKAGESLGIQDLTLTTGSTENRSEVGLSGYITPDLMIRYGVGMFEAVNTITLNYRLRKNLYLEVISGKSNAFDLLWSFDRK